MGLGMVVSSCGVLSWCVSSVSGWLAAELAKPQHVRFWDFATSAASHPGNSIVRFRWRDQRSRLYESAPSQTTLVSASTKKNSPHMTDSSTPRFFFV